VCGNKCSQIYEIGHCASRDGGARVCPIVCMTSLGLGVRAEPEAAAAAAAAGSRFLLFGRIFRKAEAAENRVKTNRKSAATFHCAKGVLITIVVYERTKVWFIIQNSSRFPPDQLQTLVGSKGVLRLTSLQLKRN
jgi:hypothetical protein